MNTTQAQKTDLLGEIVTWDMQSNEVALTRVLDSLHDAGLGMEWAKDLRVRTAFTRAVKELREGRTIDQVTRDGDIIRFQLTRKAVDEQAQRIDFAYETAITLDVSTGLVTCDSYEIEQHVRGMLAHAMGHRTAVDITRMVQAMFRGQADLFAINPRKGVAYFVPDQFRDFTAQVEQFLTSLGGCLYRFPVPKGTPVGNRSVRDAVESGLSALVGDLRQAVDDWDQTTRNSTIEKAVEKWRVLKHKAEAYSEYLGEKQQALLADLQRLQGELADKVSRLADDAEAEQPELTAA
jgi:hypothetical protein